MSALMTRMTKEQARLDKSKNQELNLARQENRLLRQQLSWFCARPSPNGKSRHWTKRKKNDEPDEEEPSAEKCEENAERSRVGSMSQRHAWDTEDVNGL